MQILLTFLNILAWATIATNTLAWAVTIVAVRKNPRLRPELGNLDFAMLLAICWLVTRWLT